MNIINMPAKRGFETKPITNIQANVLIDVFLNVNSIFTKTVESFDMFEKLSADKKKDTDRTLFLPKIIQKRIDVMKLPVRFTFGALLSILAFTDRAGAAVILLIDVLQSFVKDEQSSSYVTITTEMLVDLYPNGFYDFDRKDFQDWIDTYVKKGGGNKRIEWAEVYE